MKKQQNTDLIYVYIMLIYKWKRMKNYEYVEWTREHVYIQALYEQIR